ncbi:MAG TPA: MBL fold metallo-hydrolase [Thermodesulfobacteriota bacterium]|nr:MBL fold metallo-hydrolase [Thermodesulfobacteriota bacterium]
MRLTILGSGTCVPYARRGSSGYAVELPGAKIVLDCGSGSTKRLAEAGINYLDVDYLFLSHLHPDHTGDLAAFLFATKYAYGSPWGDTREKLLHLRGGPGFLGFLEALRGVYGDWISPEPLDPGELVEGVYEFGGFTLTAVKTPHINSSLAYRIDHAGKSLVYSGDTEYSEPLIELARGADVLIVECALPLDGMKRKGHMTPGDVVDTINRSGAKRTVITHLYPACDREDAVGRIAEAVRAEVIGAEDLLSIDV